MEIQLGDECEEHDSQKTTPTQGTKRQRTDLNGNFNHRSVARNSLGNAQLHNSRVLRSRQSTTPQANHSNRGTVSYSCSIYGCPQSFTSKSDLTAHRRTQHEQVSSAFPFVCPYPGCRNTFKHSTQLQIHERVHRDSRPFLCKWTGCRYRARQLGGITTHIRLVHFKLPKSQVCYTLPTL